MFVNYDKSILSYIASIRSYFDLDSAYEADADFSAYIKEKAPDKIFLVLIDGMGSKLFERKDDLMGFYSLYYYGETMTVFPPTTVAATTSIRNGKSPDQNGWLGWTSYIKEVDDVITIFLDESYYSDKKYPKGYIKDLIPVSDTTTELLAKGIKAFDIHPKHIEEGGYDGLEEFGQRIVDASFSDARYVYAYYDGYDSLMHKKGVDAKESDALFDNIENVLADACSRLAPDTLVIITADHGLVDIHNTINIAKTDLYKYLVRPCALEGRAAVFYIKEGMHNDFARDFKREYSDDFILLSKDEVKKSGLFGLKEAHERFDDFIGDFIAIAKGNSDIICKEDDDGFRLKAAHAGCTDDELYIPLITYMNSDS